MTTQPTTNTRTRRFTRLHPRWRDVDVQSTALGAVGNVSVELEQRSYRVVLNCSNTDESVDTISHGPGDGTTP
ncbi:MAG: hypothetical protein GF341_05475 [candidate division Zixibacteria bacterium]|nr:hypothetical protein [candidate division Zixibacteria bacterium]